MTGTMTNQASTGMRGEKLADRLEELGVDAFLVASAANRRYLSGFTGSAGTLFISPSDRLLLTDFRYVRQASLQAPGFEVIETPEITDAIAEHLTGAKLERVGFEADHTTVAGHRRLAQRLAELPRATELVPLDGVVEHQRCIKDAIEMEAIRTAVRIADEVMAVAAESLRAGMSEKSFATMLEFEMHRLGAQGPSFPIIVAAGPNAAMAHHAPGDREIRAHEPVIVDLGVVVDGYCSDITRSFAVGGGDARFREVYAIVAAAQRAACGAIGGGLSGVEADALARDPIVAAGYGDQFGHGTGHGVGLEIHEAPRVSPRSTDTLQAGMVTSVEPGIYLSDWGGIRIEDLVLIEETGAEVLSAAPK